METIRRTIRMKKVVCEVYSKELNQTKSNDWEFPNYFTEKQIKNAIEALLPDNEFLLTMNVSIDKKIYECSLADFVAIAHEVNSNDVAETNGVITE